ncbi:MAG TPA: hypothetical protein DHW63_03575 [Hyphomonadaceae bacterium]|nr:hypothetical protein [Hyphomonadaceae bacterium]
MPLLGVTTGFSIVDWPRRVRPLVLLIFALLAAFTLLILQTWRTELAENRAQAAADATGKIVTEAFVLLKRVVDAETGQRGYLLTGIEVYLEPYNRARQLLPASEARLAELVSGDPAEVGHVAEIRELMNQRLELLAAGIDARRRSGRDAAVAFVIANHGNEVMDALRMEVAGLIAEANRRARDLAVAAERAADFRAAARTISFLMALALALLILFWAVREGNAWREAAEVESQANAELAAARAKAEAAERAKERFLTTASHDLRQPLHAIRLYVDALKGRLTEGEARAIALRLDAAASSMARMFATLLDLSRLEAGVLHPSVKTESLQAILQLASEDVCEPARLGGTEVKLVPTSALVRTDRALLESIIGNLVCNAAKFAPGKRVLVGVRRTGEKVRVEVHDQGPGIPPEKLAAIFDEFTQLEPHPGGLAAGFGLGLSIAKRFSEMLGTSLEVRSTPGRGSVFSIALERADRVAMPGVPPPSARLDGQTALVFDDDAIAREATCRALADAGISVTAAGSIAEYREALARPAFDLLVLDDNWRAALGDTPVGPAVLVVTGRSEQNAFRELAVSGRSFVVKPVTAAALTRAAAAAISASRSLQRAS